MTRVPQSALEPAGIHADKIGDLWNVFLVVSAVVYVLVVIALLIALFHRRRTNGDGTRGAMTAVSIATGITVITLFALLVSSIFTSRGIAEEGRAPLQLTVTGRQWWWQIDYEESDQSKRVTTANEFSIPVGVPVDISLKSPDVIHSFWVPSLQGKQDVIPRYDGTIRLHATRAGVYRGQCAEFCGLQHAKMAFWVTALPPADYARWLDAQRQPARSPSTPRQQQGLNVFMSAQCPLCHNIQGTDASGKTAPDLTHVASRRSVAAAALPTRRAALAQWILDPQHVKPGTYMPPTPLGRDDLESLLDYLETLR
jgi:cytochrome c oxidase subunit 2